MTRLKLFTRLFAITLLGVIVYSCASIGQPDGGRFDEEPPKVVSASPSNKAVNVNRKKMSILFDEYIKLENASEKVTVSPPQNEPANIRAEGKRIRIDLYDSLRPNTTYTIDFSDAIQDNNEGNPMGMFTYYFSTGDAIDTMEVSGTVLNAQNLEPVKDLLVGLYPADSTYHDSLFTTRSMDRVGRTNGSGRFTIKGVANGRYRAFALGDGDGDMKFSQKSEQLAFDTTTFVTTQKEDFRIDTLWTDSTHWRGIKRTPYVHYYPDNLVLLSFLEQGKRYLVKNERPQLNKFSMIFSTPSDTLPKIEGLNFDASKLIVERSQHNDTLTYWVPDTNIAYMDTLTIQMTYMATHDSLDMLITKIDTLEFAAKVTHDRLEKERLKNSEDWVKDREKQQKKSKTPLPYAENPYEHTYLEMKVAPTTIVPIQDVKFTFEEPIARVDTSLIHLQQKVDTIFTEIPFEFVANELNPRQFSLYPRDVDWEVGATYQLSADSIAFESEMGNFLQKSYKADIRVGKLEEYGTIALKIHNMGLHKGETAYVQLMDKSDKPVRTDSVDAAGNIKFWWLKPGEFYLRLFVDRNGNGQWDTGSYELQQQPESVYYFPQPISVVAYADTEQGWDVLGIPRETQKPLAITKQKPDKKKSTKERNRQRDEERAKNKRR